jgi:hypothetical protein
MFPKRFNSKCILSSLDRPFNVDILRYAAMAASRVFKATLPLADAAANIR